MQGILRKLFNVHKDPWLCLKNYDVFLLPLREPRLKDPTVLRTVTNC